MFTYRFFEIPIKIVNKDAEEKNEDLGMTQVEESIDAIAKILPLQIESYRESIPSGTDFVEENKRCVTVYMKSGDSYVVYWSMKEFEKRLNEFDEKVIHDR